MHVFMDLLSILFSWVKGRPPSTPAKMQVGKTPFWSRLLQDNQHGQQLDTCHRGIRPHIGMSRRLVARLMARCEL